MNVYELINQLIYESLRKHGINLEMISAEKALVSDLRAESLDIIEMLLAFEDTFSIWIEEKDLSDIVTVGDIYNLVQSHLGAV